MLAKSSWQICTRAIVLSLEKCPNSASCRIVCWTLSEKPFHIMIHALDVLQIIYSHLALELSVDGPYHSLGHQPPLLCAVLLTA